MATGFTSQDKRSKGGKESKKDKLKVICDTCNENFHNTDGEVYCLECNQYYCHQCLKPDHRENQKFHDHTLIKKEDFIKGAKENQEMEAVCQEHPKLLVDVYCPKHDQVGCNICMRKYHRSDECQLKYIPEYANRDDIKKETQERVTYLHKELDKLSTMAGQACTKTGIASRELRKITKTITEILTEIVARTRGEIHQQLENVENMILDYHKQRDELLEKISTGLKVVRCLIREGRDPEHPYICGMLMTVAKAKDDLEKLGEIPRIKLEFIPNAEFDRIFVSNKNMGAIEFESSRERDDRRVPHVVNDGVTDLTAVNEMVAKMDQVQASITTFRDIAGQNGPYFRQSEKLQYLIDNRDSLRIGHLRVTVYKRTEMDNDEEETDEPNDDPSDVSIIIGGPNSPSRQTDRPACEKQKATKRNGENKADKKPAHDDADDGASDERTQPKIDPTICTIDELD